ncbi:CocE/NonD family hydrolase [Nocardia paucivorans]|uniref:CocE/NonD family hydrolase n=1 Tax=Nocardia paucivorans TaxID=114259 RepID=UPI0002FBF63B|nr:CocE/NonD family hydrolase [Nocardia paucivorans]
MRRSRAVPGAKAAIVLTVAAMATALTGVATITHQRGGGATEPAVSAAELAQQWTRTHDGPQPYAGEHVESNVQIAMSDGVLLKADVYRPVTADGQVETRPLPTIVTMTPYSKMLAGLIEAAVNRPELQPPALDLVGRINLSGTPLSGFGDLIHALDGGTVPTVLGLDRKLVRAGYTLVAVDVRGTGWSQGTWDTLGAREQQDTREVIEWAAEQPWSNGKIAMSGGSYAGINQLRAAENAPAPLKAIFPVVPGSDLMRDIVAPGGGVGITFLPLWLTSVNRAKLIPDIASMLDGTFDWQWLGDRLASPATNFDLLAQALLTPSIAEMPDTLREALDADSAFRQGIMGRPERVTVPTFVYGGWHDIFANSATTLYNAIPLPPGHKQLMVGDTYHANPGSGTGRPGAPPRLDVLQRAWFDHWLSDIPNGITDYGPVTVWEQGGDWVTLDRFPQPGATHRRVYLSDAPSGTTAGSVHDGSLIGENPASHARLTVAPGLSTLCSRDAAQGSAGLSALIDACAKDSRIAELNALTFTSAPVAEPTVISGPINVHLNTVHEATDGYWSVTVNDVAPDGTSTVLSTGQLAASLRAIDETRSARSANGDLTAPHNPITLDSMLPVPPGEPIVLDIAVIPTQAVLQPGHRLRLDVFAGNPPKALPFRPLLNNTELKPQQLVLDPDTPSFVNLPTDRPLPRGPETPAPDHPPVGLPVATPHPVPDTPSPTAEAPESTTPKPDPTAPMIHDTAPQTLRAPLPPAPRVPSPATAPPGPTAASPNPTPPAPATPVPRGTQ